MGTDDLPSEIIFIVSLLLFCYLSLAEHVGSNGNGQVWESAASRRVRQVILPFKYATVMALSLSGVALVQGVWSLSWWPIAILALALLVLLTLVLRLSSSFANRNPALAQQLASPLCQTILSYGEARARKSPNSAGANGRKTAEGAPAESMIPEGALAGLPQRDQEMLRSILRLDVATAREAMVHRLYMVAVDVNSTPAEAVEPVIKSGHSRIPVYEDSIDHIVGVVHARDLLELLSQPERDATLADLMRPAYFIPETKRLDDLLDEFQQKAVQMAIVVDEYGGTEGLITMEDLLEEIVGEIEDEFSRDEAPEVVHLPNGSVLVSGELTTECVEELFSASLNSAEGETTGDYVYQTLGRLPQVGDVVETSGVRIEIVSLLGHRIRRLRIERMAGEPSAPSTTLTPEVS